MKDYASMSDQQINREVQKLTGIGCMSGNGVLIISDGRWRTFDPCNNPADAWPIITENKICLIPEIGDGTWWAMYQPIIQIDWRVYDDGKPIENNANPLRAAMIVFLMMKEGEK